jgi:hypothetical protein
VRAHARTEIGDAAYIALMALRILSATPICSSKRQNVLCDGGLVTPAMACRPEVPAERTGSARWNAFIVDANAERSVVAADAAAAARVRRRAGRK